MATDSLFRAALEALGEPILLFGPDQKVAFATLKALEVFGMLREELEDQDEATVRDAFVRHGIKAEGALFSLPIGSELERRVKTLPGGGRLEVFHDVTEERAHKARQEQVLSVATHDLRSPLANIRSYASLLLAGRMTEVDPRVRRAAEVISRNADKALKLMQSYFDSLRAEAGGIHLDKQPVALLPIIDEAVASRRPLMREKGVDLVESMPDRLPQALVDRDRVAQVFATFLDNAISRAKPRTSIELTCEERRGDLYVALTDHGSPLPPDEERHAFDRDYQIVKERRLGLGFSLAVASSTVAAHGGTAGVKTTNGGTTYFFTMPRE